MAVVGATSRVAMQTVVVDVVQTWVVEIATESFAVEQLFVAELIYVVVCCTMTELWLLRVLYCATKDEQSHQNIVKHFQQWILRTNKIEHTA